MVGAGVVGGIKIAIGIFAVGFDVGAFVIGAFVGFNVFGAFVGLPVGLNVVGLFCGEVISIPAKNARCLIDINVILTDILARMTWCVLHVRYETGTHACVLRLTKYARIRTCVPTS